MFDEEKLTDKTAFYSSLDMGKISDIDYRHAKKYLINLILKI